MDIYIFSILVEEYIIYNFCHRGHYLILASGDSEVLNVEVKDPEIHHFWAPLILQFL